MDYFDILIDSFFDTLNLVPFLFIAYIVLEYIEHKSEEKMLGVIQKSKRFGPFIGGVLGLFPHCGFSAIASSFYSTRIITLGTLFAVFLSTSDEMLPIFLSEGVGAGVILKILFIKFFLAMVFGFLIDFIFKTSLHREIKIREFCTCSHCHCGEGVLYPALNHTVKISGWIFVFTFILSCIMEFIGEEQIVSIFSNNVYFTNFLTAGIGLIPNCASSVILSKLYIGGVINFSSLVCGLLVGAGLGLIVLFKMNKSLRENIFILLGLYFIAVFSGIVLQFLGV